MVDMVLQTWREKPISVVVNKEDSFVFTDSQPNYINTYNYSPNQVFVSRSPGVTPTHYDFAIPPFSNRQWAWGRGISAIYFYQAGPGEAPIRITSYEAPFDPAAVVQSGQNIVIAQALDISSLPNVTVNGPVEVEGSVGIVGTVPVSGTVGISGTVPVSGTVGISGTVPVIISNVPHVVVDASNMDSVITSLVTEIADLKTAIDALTAAILAP